MAPQVCAPTAAELRGLLASLKIDGPTDASAKDMAELLRKALRRGQGIPAQLGDLKHSSVNPDELPAWPNSSSASDAFDNWSVQESMGFTFAPDSVTGNPYFEMRRSLMEAVEGATRTGCTRVVIQDDAQSQGIMLDIMGIKQFKEGVPLVEVRYSFSTRDRAQSDPKWAQAMHTSVPHGSRMISCPANLPEVQLLATLLQLNSKYLSKEYLAAKATDPQWQLRRLGDFFAASFVCPCHPLSEPVKLGPKCAVCGKHAPTKCSRCKERNYCGKECQVQDWKVGHKAACKPKDEGGSSKAAPSSGTAAAASSGATGSSSGSSSSSGDSVTVELACMPGFWGSVSLQQDIRAQARRGPNVVQGGRRLDRPVDASRRFIVKLQAPLDTLGPNNGALMLYDAKRKIQGMIQAHQPGYSQLLRAVRSQPMYGGVKAYMYATQVGEGELRIETEPGSLPSQMQPW